MEEKRVNFYDSPDLEFIFLSKEDVISSSGGDLGEWDTNM